MLDGSIANSILKKPGSVNDRRDIDTVFADAIDYAVAVNKHFADGVVIKFRHFPREFWKDRGTLDCGNDSLNDFGCVEL